jgi:predicted esterase
VIIFFDPHAEGSLPVGKYARLANRSGTILMGSNTSKNGMQFEQTNAVAQALVQEANHRLAADPRRIALAGFSGGAKAALMASSVTTGMSFPLFIVARPSHLIIFNTCRLALGIAGTAGYELCRGRK